RTADQRHGPEIGHAVLIHDVDERLSIGRELHPCPDRVGSNVSIDGVEWVATTAGDHNPQNPEIGHGSFDAVKRDHLAIGRKSGRVTSPRAYPRSRPAINGNFPDVSVVVEPLIDQPLPVGRTNGTVIGRTGGELLQVPTVRVYPPNA